MTATLQRIVDQLLKTDVGRQAAAAAAAEDVDARRVFLREIAGARRWGTVELERLEPQRLAAEARYRRAKEEFDAAQLQLAEIERQIRDARWTAEHRIGVAEKELRLTSDDRIWAAIETLRDLAVETRRQFGVYEDRKPIPGDFYDRKTVSVVSNQGAIDAMLAEIRRATTGLEALMLDDVTHQDVTVQLAAVRGELLATARRHGFQLTWPERV